MTQRFICILFSLLFLFSTGCSVESSPPKELSGGIVTDALGQETVIKKDARVVSCYGSFGDCWLLSGGTLAGVTDDAFEQGVVPKDSLPVVGSVKNIDLEKVLSLAPDYVILSADLAAHRKLQSALDTAKIAYGYFRVDTFKDYKGLMRQFCAVNGGEDPYREYVLEPEERISEIMKKIPTPSASVLLVRVYSTGMKAKGDDNLAGQILKEFGLHNLVDDNPSLLEDLSVEKILLEDPDHILALTMGEQEAAETFLRQNVENNPAWSGLSAVKNQRYHTLPKDLFHYKPNERWDESYEYLAKLIYPEIFG